MIYAKTTMTRMPPTCATCKKRRYIISRGGNRCSLAERDCPEYGRDAVTGSRPTWCPLTEIDETLPAQLECAELRLRKDDRLRN